MSRDLMHTAEIKDLVRDAYRHVPPTTAAVAHNLYSDEELALVPQSAIDRALGVANHLRHATIRSGDTVLDLGCGGGIDTILAAHRTGPAGRVIALDFLPEMLTRTPNAASEAGLSNVEPSEGELEAIPLPDDSVDLIISNGVINLSARKARVIAECARVLKPGGDVRVGPDRRAGRPAARDPHPAGGVGRLRGRRPGRGRLLAQASAGPVHGAQVLHRQPLSIDDCALYPRFSDDVIAPCANSFRLNGRAGWQWPLR